MELVWIQNLKALIKTGMFRDDERWKKIFLDQLDAINEENASLRAENAELKAGIKRLSDEEEFFSENGRDGMLTAVHIGARLAEAEALARAMEAEANQMREVSISNRHRAEAAEATCEKLAKALDQAQMALASMIDPSCIAQTTVIYAFATATTAEATARHVLSAYRKEASE